MQSKSGLSQEGLKKKVRGKKATAIYYPGHVVAGTGANLIVELTP